MIKFNTGREYTEHGQRIAAQRDDDTGTIILVDLDRHIDMMLPAGVELTQSDVMWAYDLHMQVFPSEVGMNYADYYAIVGQLRDAAASI
jgi:hypothetical protein